MAFERPELQTLRRFGEHAVPCPAALCVEIVGLPGSGRSTLLASLRDDLAARGWAAVEARCYPGAGSARRSLAELGEMLARGMPALHRKTIELTIRDAQRRLERVSSVFEMPTTAESRLNLYPVMKARFGAAPVVFLLDDGQFAEPSFLRLLFHFLATTCLPDGGAPRMLVAATAGNLELPARYPWELALRQLTLEPLSTTDCESLLGRLGAPLDAAAAAAPALLQHGMATPRSCRLLAEELAIDRPGASAMERLLQNDGRLLTARRYWRLPEESRALLQVAAISRSGINFWRQERLSISSREEVERLTLALEEQGWLRRAYPGGRLRFPFRQDEERRIVAGLSSAEELCAWHQRFAKMLEDDDLDPGELASEIGRHLVAAGDLGEGATRLMRAGRHLVRRNRREEARQHFEEVVRLGRESSHVGREALLAREGLLDLDMGQGNLDETVRGYRQLLADGEGTFGPDDLARVQRKVARRQLDEGRLEDASATVALCRAAADALSPVERALLHDLMAHVLIVRGDLAAAAAEAQEALTIALATQDERMQGRFYETLGQIGYARGDIQLALSELDTALDIFDRAGDTAGYANACVMKGNAHNKLAQFDEALRWYQAALEVYEELQDLMGVTKALHNVAAEAVRADDLDRAEESLMECRRIYRRTGSLDGVAISCVNLAAIASQRGRYARSLDLALEAARVASRLGHDRLRLAAQNSVVTALVSLGRLAPALATAQEVARDARATEANVQLVHALNSQGMCYLQCGALQAAREKTLEALGVAREHDLRVEEWDSLNQLVDVEMTDGKPGAARACFEESLKRVSHPFQERESRFQEVELRLSLGDGRPSAADLATLEGLTSAATADLAARTHLLLARVAAPDRALDHARRACALFRELEAREFLWRALHRLGVLEQDLGIPGSKQRFEEAAHIILAIAVDLSPELRERYMLSLGRERLLESALGDRA